MYLLLILACIFTIAVILLLRVKDPLQQVFIFLVTLLVFMGFHFLFSDMAKTTTLSTNDYQEEENIEIKNLEYDVGESQESQESEIIQNLNSNVNEDLIKEIIQKINKDEVEKTNYLLNPLNNEDYDPAYSPDKLIPNCSYNLNDCTNDLSCIIPPSNANLFGPITPKTNTLSRKSTNHSERKCRVLPDITIDRSKHCNNCGGILPSAKKVKNNCSDIEKVINNYDNLCIHCKVSVRMNSNCFNNKELPIEYYPI